MSNVSIEIPDAKKLQVDELHSGDVQVTVWAKTSLTRWRVMETFIIPQNRRELISKQIWLPSSK
jgi:hypothetical protein